MNKLTKTIIVAAGLSLGLQFCTSNKDESALRKVDPPFKNLEVPEHSWSMKHDEAKTFNASSGSIISIPENAFTYVDGTTPSGDVNIKYKEYLDGLDIVASGIPMVFDSAGVSYDFVSAGMLSIRSYDEKGEELILKEGKKIDIQMASHKEGDFNLYFFNEEPQEKTSEASLLSSIFLDATPLPSTIKMGQWENIQNSLKTTVNEEKLALMDKLVTDSLPNEPLKPKAFNPDNFVFDLNINVDAYPEFKHFKGILWEYVGMKGAKDPEKNDWIFTENWTNMSIERHKKKGVYQLQLKNKITAFTTLVKPVLDGDDYKKALKAFDKQFEEYQTVLAQRKIEENRLRKMGGILRAFQLTSTGIWNVDKINRLKNEAIMVNANIEIDDQSVAIPQTFFYITDNNNGTVAMRYTKDRWKEFFIIQSTKPYLIAPLEDGRIALFSKNDMQGLSIDAIENGSSFTFTMKVLKEDAPNLEELKTLISKRS